MSLERYWYVVAESREIGAEAVLSRRLLGRHLVLFRNADGQPAITLDDATLRFVEASDGRDVGLGGLDVDVVDAERILREAEARGCRTGDDQVMICGIRFRLV